MVLRFERSPYSPYQGADRNSDLLPYFLYDSKLLLPAVGPHRAEAAATTSAARAEIFLRRRLEGFASDRVPESMVGQTQRFSGDDLGVAGRWKLGAGVVYGEVMRNVSDESDGTELRLGYRYEQWWNGRFRWRPYATLAWRDAKLNNYYYGVPGLRARRRPQPRARRARRLPPDPTAGSCSPALGLTHWSSGVRDSPVVDDGTQLNASVGLLYSFKPDQPSEWDRTPLIVRFGYGQSTDCDLMPIVARAAPAPTRRTTPASCSSTSARSWCERVNGWPLDLAGFIGFVKHEERGLQDDFWQINAYFKLYYYFGPWWRDTLRTRFGFGAGISYASRIPFSEQRDQALRGRDTSKLLLYLDPTIDINIGDLFKARELRETYVGIGVSHRSGIFGSSRLFNSVDGGSNYIYGFVETGF